MEWAAKSAFRPNRLAVWREDRVIIKIAGKTQQDSTHRGSRPSYRSVGPGGDLYDRANCPSCRGFLSAGELTSNRFDRLFRGGLNLRPIVQAGVPITASLRCDVEEVPDRSKQIDAALLDFGRHPRVRRVEVAHGAVCVTRENRNG